MFMIVKNEIALLKFCIKFSLAFFIVKCCLIVSCDWYLSDLLSKFERYDIYSTQEINCCNGSANFTWNVAARIWLQCWRSGRVSMRSLISCEPQSRAIIQTWHPLYSLVWSIWSPLMLYFAKTFYLTLKSFSLPKNVEDGHEDCARFFSKYHYKSCICRIRGNFGVVHKLEAMSP